MVEITLNDGSISIIDDEDYDLVKNRNWTHSNGYVISCAYPEKGTIYMHRLINKTPNGMSTDHINGNKLDNRKCNLRTCTHAENRRNNKIQTNNKSGYTGVSGMRVHQIGELL
ncbi:MAG: hypothetical protein E6R03_01310 [Hyphomicrobiaceae bacterium]|nr:MAG: hypothetical protein E6R03_01310 [Hyphomicrobiaceae bacterium]